MIQTIEETRTNKKTTEISIENSKRVLLNDNNLSTSCAVTEKSCEISRRRETNDDDDNGDILDLVEQKTETFNDKEEIIPKNNNNNNNIISSNNIVSCSNNNDGTDAAGTNALTKLTMNTSSSCGNLLLSANTYQGGGGSNKVAASTEQIQPKTISDFTVPYNIINNYFSVGVVSDPFLKKPLSFFMFIILPLLVGRRHLRKVPSRT